MPTSRVMVAVKNLWLCDLGSRRAGRVVVAIVGSAAALSAVGCGRPFEGTSGDHRVQRVVVEDLGEQVSMEVEAESVASVDWEEAVYLSACGLSDVRVTGGVGEASSLGVTYGIEVVDVDFADLDGDGADEAAVLVDCLGGDSYQPHVIVVPPDGVLGGEVPQLAVSSGGSMPAGDRPLEVEALEGGTINVTVLDNGRPVMRTLGYADDVLIGGELTPRTAEVISGVIASVAGGTAVVAVTPDDGYRLSVPAGLMAVDSVTGAQVAIEQVVGLPVTVTVGDGGSVGAVALVPAPGGM